MASCSSSLAGKSISFLRSENRVFTQPTHSSSIKPSIAPLRACLTAKNLTTNPIISVDRTKDKNNSNDSISPDKLDDWIQTSVTEIVRNIEEAPFLVHVYSNKSTSTTPIPILEREKAGVDTWSSITRRWDQGSKIPDGVILVEQIDVDDVVVVDEDDDWVQEQVEENPKTTKTWGLVIQGRGVDRAACYILKTCRVLSTCGICTHFCLVRAKCFGDTPQLQLDNSWLIHN